MAEYRADPDQFFVKYGGGPSTGYDLIDDVGYTYPPAAIVQAALNREDVKGGLKHSDSAGVALKFHGFRVIEKGKFRREPATEKDKAQLLGIEETERLGAAKVRIGAGTLRQFALKHRVCCEVTDIVEPELLRVSHIVAWSEDKPSRLDPDNIILLSSLWDAAFDRGMISFNMAGCAIFGPRLAETTLKHMRFSESKSLAISDARSEYLARHRRKHGFR
ncbi:MAG: HNH endonuclease [Sphingomonas bacterium]|nr:HNH endonuclease [Sphingomonas bacterium]